MWMTVLRLLAVIATGLGAWQSWKAMGDPLVRGGRRWYLQPDGNYRRWYGGRARTRRELDALDEH